MYCIKKWDETPWHLSKLPPGLKTEIFDDDTEDIDDDVDDNSEDNDDDDIDDDSEDDEDDENVTS